MPTTDLLTRDMVDAAKKRIEEVDVPHAKILYDSEQPPLFIDVRRDEEWQQGHIRGAIHIFLDRLDNQIKQQCPDQNQVIILYCASGGRSAVATDYLQSLGYNNVKSMLGGYKAWKPMGFPTEPV